MHLSDRFTGAFLIGLGAVAAYAGSRLPPVPGQQVGPNVFPMVVGIGLALCGLMIMLGWGRRFEEEAEAELAAHVDPEPANRSGLGKLDRLKALLPPALLLFYVFAADRLGFLPAAAVMVFATALALKAPLRLALPLAIAAPAAVHLIFSKLLRVPLPAGLLPAPW
jgi:putative tricarboxylic transport membrane protein